MPILEEDNIQRIHIQRIEHTRSTAKIFAQIKTRYGRRSSLVACNKRST